MPGEWARRGRRSRRLWVAGIAALLFGCSSPPTHFYTLTAVPPARPVTAGVPLSPPIEVGDVPVPAVLDRDAIVLSEGDRLDISGQDEWGAPLGRLIRQTLTADMMFRLPPGSVLAPGSTAPRSGLRILSVNVLRFGGDAAGTVVLDASWSLLKAGTSDVLRSGHEVIHARAASGKVADVVPAMGQALGELADRLAGAIAG
ncbi:MAG TPA: PqiC family protein [Acetobacteraceae bacterium]